MQLPYCQKYASADCFFGDCTFSQARAVKVPKVFWPLGANYGRALG